MRLFNALQKIHVGRLYRNDHRTAPAVLRPCPDLLRLRHAFANDFRGRTACDALVPFSLVCKAASANGHPTVKLSDNPNKAMGPADEIARYKPVFRVGEQEAMEVVV